MTMNMNCKDAEKLTQQLEDAALGPDDRKCPHFPVVMS